jgi:hypothetical protein
LALNPAPYQVPQQFLKDAETQNYFIRTLHPFLRLAKQNIDTLNTLTEALTAADTALNTLITDEVQKLDDKVGVVETSLATANADIAALTASLVTVNASIATLTAQVAAAAVPTYGTWTPTFTTGSGSVSYSTQTGKWAKIGDLLFIDGKILLSSESSSGTVQITGLPEPIKSGHQGIFSFHYEGWSGLYAGLTGYADGSVIHVRDQYSNGTRDPVLSNTSLTEFNGWYIT